MDLLIVKDDDVDAFLAERVDQCQGDLGLIVLEDRLASLQKRHLAAEAMEQLPQLKGPSCSVMTVRVAVEADPARAKAILEKVDWAALKALIR